MSLKDYDSLSRLGSGSFGVVYKGKHKKSNEWVVIKEIQTSKLDRRMKNWALNQAKIMKEITCRYIVKCIASFMGGSKLYIVMEYCSRGDLSMYVKAQMGKPIKQDIIWKFSIQIMIGLRELHGRKILHRDIKALNIFLDEGQNIKIGDLGVAKEMKANTDFTNTIVGTPYYLSPEMCEEKPYNEKTDVWAMGCLIYELATGRHPFQANNQAALALKIVVGKYAPIPSHYSKELQWVIKSCLSVDYKRRPTISYLLSHQKIIQIAHRLSISLERQEKEKKEGYKEQKEGKQKEKEEKERMARNYQSVPDIVNSGSGSGSNFAKKPQIAKKSQSKEKRKISVNRKSEPISNKQKQVLPPPVVKQQPVIKPAPKQNIVPSPSFKKQANKPQADKKAQLKEKKIQIKIVQKEKEKEKEKNIIQSPKVNAAKIPPPTPKFISPSNEIKPQSPQQQQQQHQKAQQMSPRKKQSSAGLDYMEKVKEKKDIDIEDKNRIRKEEKQLLNEIEKKPIAGMQRKANLVGYFQKEIDDDELMAEFGVGVGAGITPQKKLQLTPAWQIKKVKTINWDTQLQEDGTSTNYKQLPTIKTPSGLQSVQVINVKGEDEREELIAEEIDDNAPYKSDEEEGGDEDDGDNNELIQDIQRQIEEEEEMKVKDKIVGLQKRIVENEKRKKELQQLKSQHESELLQKISKGDYLKLKEMVMQGSESDIELLLSKWMKNGLIKFYKIFHFDLEIERCDNNISTTQAKIKQLSK